MDTIPLITLIFYSIPESFLIFMFGYVILNVRIQMIRILQSTVISVLFSYIVRQLPLPFGWHTVLGFLIICLIFRFICKFNPKQSFIATLFSFSTMLALENLCLYLLQVQFNVSANNFLHKSPWRRTILGWPQLSVWSLLTWFLYKQKISLTGGFLNGPNRAGR